ncbi:glycerol-3-phosphate 1-O-acyltransferase PlsY [Rubritalea tangerina]|uniref:Glycerol-3-phosphate acyltransferase n=1 Tax=Rubritalea tangerina TaxID=430798 RepID=A0ABW4Z8F7_9BACT
MPIWIPPIVAFLLGSIPFGLLIAKSQGINIREHGSGNIGATNVLRVVGKKYGITCFILDFFKGLVPSLLGISLIQYSGQDQTMVISSLSNWATTLDDRTTAQSLQLVTGLCAILGHNYSPWVGFKGGKGIATSAGVFTAFAPFAIPVLIVLWCILFFTTRYVSVASIAVSLALPLTVLFGSWHHGKIENGTWNKPLFFFSIFIGAMAVWKHRSNIVKLLNGTENRFTPKSKKS